jgi:putative ABC transport system substrate-binding protein
MSHKLLIRSKPSDLPVEVPTKFQLLIKSAKALFLTVPPTPLARAEVIHSL